MSLTNDRKQRLRWDIYLRICELAENEGKYRDEDREYLRECAYRVGKLFNIDRYLIK